MRIVFVIPGPPETVSGGYRYDREMIGALAGMGHAVEIVPPDRFSEVAGDAVVVIDGLALPDAGIPDDRLAAPRTIGLIHHPTALETGLAEGEAARRRALETALYGRLHRLIVTSDVTLGLLTAEFGVAAERIAVVAPGTSDAARSPGSDSATCHVLSVGALVPRKGHDVLMRALARLFDLDWHLTIVGNAARDAVHARTLESLAVALKIAQRVTFAGEVDEPGLETLWQRADLFALATRFEGYGMAVAEALKRGVPPAVTAGGAAGALISPEAGTVCAIGEFDTYSKGLRRMIFDRRLRRDMAEAAWKIGQTLPDWPTQAALFAKALDQ